MIGIAKSTGCELPLASQRMEMLDVARLVAAIGIIILHVAGLDEETADLVHLGRFAVPFFAIAAVALTVHGLRSNPSKSLVAYAWSRVLRIYVPFLFWTFAYIVFRDVKYRFVTHQPLVPLDAPLLIVGSAHHLWFLPFILLVTFFAAVAAKYFLFRLSAWVVVPISLCLALVVFLAPNPEVPITPVGDADGLSIQYFVGLAWRALPMALVGVGFGRVWQEMRSLPYLAMLAWIGLVVAVLSLALMPTFNDALALQDISGIGAAFFALGPWHNRWINLVASWGQAAYGIYLVHVLWYLSLDVLFTKLHLADGMGSIWMLIALTTVCSTLSALLLSKSRFTAWTIGMIARKRDLPA